MRCDCVIMILSRCQSLPMARVRERDTERDTERETEREGGREGGREFGENIEEGGGLRGGSAR